MINKAVLIVDDDIDILNIFKHFLKGEVQEIDTLNDPRKVLNALNYKQYDLVITDILMPGINGIELTKMIRKKYPNLKIVVCSEGGETDAKEIVASIVLNKAIEFGALYALKKPFNKTEVLDAIIPILEGDLPPQVN